MSDARLAAFVEQFDGLRVGVVGDLMLDRYIWGRASRISQEAPVPVVHVRDESVTPGGAANVARNVTALRGQGTIFGVVGKDRYGDVLVNLLSECNVDVSGVVVDAHRCTTAKTRVIAGTQQVVRIDREDTLPLDEISRQALFESIEAAVCAGRLDALILEDYAKGVLNRELGEQIIRLCHAHGVCVSLDPHAANAFGLGGLRLMTPNRAEAFALTGAYYRRGVMPMSDDAALLDVGARLMQLWGPELLLITLGSSGMALFEQGKSPLHIPTRAREVFDVSGAGDTVMATFVMSLLAGALPADAARLANHAAGIVVAEVGTAAVTAEELLADLRGAATSGTT